MGNCLSYYRQRKSLRELQNTDFTSMELFTFKGLDTNAKVLSVYDGDTVTLVFKYKGIYIKDRFRMYGYDSPEMKPLKKIADRDLHIAAAKVAQKKLEELVLNKVVRVVFSEEEKYGRLMGKLYKDNLCINDWMVTSGLGLSYHGKTKTNFTTDHLEKICRMNK